MQNFKIDFITNTIIITKAFYEAAMNHATNEYVFLQEVKKENPEMTVAIK